MNIKAQIITALHQLNEDELKGVLEYIQRNSIVSAAGKDVVLNLLIRDDAILSGEPIIKGTRTPVREIALIWKQGVSPEEIPLHLPHLTLAQVFAALSYYCAHIDEIDSYIERNWILDELIDPLVKAPKFGSARGLIQMSDDFDEPLEDFKEYMF